LEWIVKHAARAAAYTHGVADECAEMIDELLKVHDPQAVGVALGRQPGAATAQSADLLKADISEAGHRGSGDQRLDGLPGA
jgi:hypothetical protein